ncbi:hypothetical protein FACS189479_05030 [Spirochaetia bacterium]|nr:hypothetical protein FACS189479_05030 [Spirochaetia bacterium]
MEREIKALELVKEKITNIVKDDPSPELIQGIDLLAGVINELRETARSYSSMKLESIQALIKFYQGWQYDPINESLETLAASIENIKIDKLSMIPADAGKPGGLNIFDTIKNGL